MKHSSKKRVGWHAARTAGALFLQNLVDGISMDGDAALLRCDYMAVKNAIVEKKKGTSKEVPCFKSEWRARDDSNVRPLPSEGNTLSS